MKVKVIYRNYKPLHEIYRSFYLSPPKGVELFIPQPAKHLKLGFKIYRKFGDYKIFKKALQFVQNKFFAQTKESNDDFDLYHFIQLIPKKIPNKPYIVDIEHIVGLMNFVKPDEITRQNIINFLLHENCKKIIALSNAAKFTLTNYLRNGYKNIEEKIEVVYPSLPNFYKIYKDGVDYSIIKNDDSLKILFVGNDVYRKGLHELLEAVKRLDSYKKNISVYLISNADKELKEKYNLENVKYLDPNFSKEEIIKKFFLPSDIFVMPTHGDTFGMVYLDSLSSGTPVITTKQFATPEIIRENENGFFVYSDHLYLEEIQIPTIEDSKTFFSKIPEEKLVNELAEKIEYIYKNKKILSKMKEEVLKDFEVGGKFCITKRNETLERIYKEAVKK